MDQPILKFIFTQNYKNLSLSQSVELKNLNIFIISNGSGKSIVPENLQKRCPLFRELYNYLHDFCSNY